MNEHEVIFHRFGKSAFHTFERFGLHTDDETYIGKSTGKSYIFVRFVALIYRTFYITSKDVTHSDVYIYIWNISLLLSWLGFVRVLYDFEQVNQRQWRRRFKTWRMQINAKKLNVDRAGILSSSFEDINIGSIICTMMKPYHSKDQIVIKEMLTNDWMYFLAKTIAEIFCDRRRF